MNLKDLVNHDQYIDNTARIRELKHSEPILLDIAKICEFKQKNAELRKTNPIEFYNLCVSGCNFLYTHYTDIFNRVITDELDLKLFVDFVKVLKRIEENDIDQYQGSVIVGKMLHDIYIDSSKRKGAKYDEISAQEKEKEEAEFVKPIKMSWKDYKNKQK